MERNGSAKVSENSNAAIELTAMSENSDSHFAAAPTSVRIGILTVSDRSSSGAMEDLSGPAIQKALGDKFLVSVYACIADERKLISKTLRRWADGDLCDCIVTTGGTGLGERDVTPEATIRVLDQHLPALAMNLALEGAKTVPTAVLSRGIAGARGKTLIVNLPGSPDGAGAGAALLAAVIPHAVQMLSGNSDEHQPRVAEAASHAELR